MIRLYGARVRTAAAVMAAAAGVSAFLVFVPRAEQGNAVARVAPIVLFLVTVSIVVNLAARAGVFESAAVLIARAARERVAALWGLTVAGAAVSTAFLSLDTTAVLVTPMAVSLAVAAGVEAVPFALTVVWIANAGSLFLPVSNLTNLLAGATGLYGSTIGFARVAALPAAAALAVVIAFAAVVLWRSQRGSGSSVPRGGVASPPDLRDGHGGGWRDGRGLRRLCAAVLLVLLPLLASPIPYWWSTSAAAVVLLGAFAYGDRDALRPSLVPWGAVAFAVVLIAVVEVIHEAGLGVALHAVIDSAGGSAGRAGVLAAGGAAASNIVNNLPAYLLLEPAASTPRDLLALLIGTNAGALVTPWASLATLLWADQLRRSGTRPPWGMFVRCGAVLAPLAVGLPLVMLLWE